MMVMAKKNIEISYRCSTCGYTQSKWLGRCPSCGAWNAFEEIPVLDSHAGSVVATRQNKTVEVVPLETVKSQDEMRLSTGLKEFDRVLGGGAIKRSSIIVAGEPGIGKSTLLLQAAALTGKKVLYISGEESQGQIKARAVRLGLPLSNIELLCSSHL